MKLAQAERLGNLYPDRHLNVFVPYQSHDLDQNVTRALVATLRWSRSELTREFLKQIVGVENLGEGAFHYDLQACDYDDFHAEQVGQQLVLGISIAGRLADSLPSLDDVNQEGLRTLLRMPIPIEVKLSEVRRSTGRPEIDLEDLAVLAHTLDELEDGSLPDGWIFSPEAGVCVLIEAKLLERLDLYQLQRYSEVWYGRSQQPHELILRSWEEVASLFARYAEDSDPATAFLCRQFHDYLDLLGLAKFHGFKPYDFDPDSFQEALAKFVRFGKTVHEHCVARGLPVGPLRVTPTGVRLPFAQADLPGEIALDLLEQGVRIEHRSGDSPGGRVPGRAAVDRILAVNLEGGKNPLANAHPKLWVRIERLRSSDPEAPGFVEKVTLDEQLDAETFGDYVLSELRRQHPPQEHARDGTGHCRHATLSIGRLIERQQALGDDGGQTVLEASVGVVAELVEVARRLVGEGSAAPETVTS